MYVMQNEHIKVLMTYAPLTDPSIYFIDLECEFNMEITGEFRKGWDDV